MKDPEILHAEEDKQGTEHILLPCKSPELKANPLLHNKGLPKTIKASLNPLKKAPEVKKKSKKFSAAFLDDTAKSPSGYDVIGMSEFGEACGLPGIKEIITIPLSEMNMDYLTFQKTIVKAEAPNIIPDVKEEDKEDDAGEKYPETIMLKDKIKRKRQELLGMPAKLQSMGLPEDDGMKPFEEKLSPEQFDFLKKVYAYKDNYYIHALRMGEINNQYVSIFRYLRKISESEAVLKQLKHFASQADKYAKNIVLYKSIFFTKALDKKTLLLDLDETLIHASPKESKHAVCVFKYIEEDGDDKELRKVSIFKTIAIHKGKTVFERVSTGCGKTL